MNNFDKFLNKIYIKHSKFIDHTTKYILNEYPDKYGFITKKQKYDAHIFFENYKLTIRDCGQKLL